MDSLDYLDFKNQVNPVILVIMVKIFLFGLEVGLVMGHGNPLPTSPKRGKGWCVWDEELGESFDMLVLILAL